MQPTTGALLPRWAQGCSVAWFTRLVHNVFDNLWVQHIYLVMALMLGLLAVLNPNETHLQRPDLE